MKEIPRDFAPPRGMRDFYPEDMTLRQAIVDAWREAAAASGFAPYDACVVENLDLLRRKAGEEIVDQIYAFRDKSGRELALRPEMTPTLARMVAARQGALTFPLKWTTIAQCFRYERMTRGRKREHYQWNLDIVGEPSPAAEVEVIATAVAALDRLGLDRGDYRVRYSSRELLAAMLDRLGVPADQHPAAFLALDKRGKLDDDAIGVLLETEGLAADARARVFELMQVATLEQALELAGRAADASLRARLDRFHDGLTAFDLTAVLHFDIGVIRGLAYYTGIVFEGFDTAGELRAIFGGGRYDNLLASVGGAAATGVGLGFGDVVIAELLAARGLLPDGSGRVDLCVGFMTEDEQSLAMRITAARRRSGQRVDLATAPEKPKRFFHRSAASGAARALYIGPDDRAAGTVKLKTLADRSEEMVAIEGLIGG